MVESIPLAGRELIHAFSVVLVPQPSTSTSTAIPQLKVKLNKRDDMALMWSSSSGLHKERRIESLLHPSAFVMLEIQASVSPPSTSAGRFLSRFTLPFCRHHRHLECHHRRSLSGPPPDEESSFRTIWSFVHSCKLCLEMMWAAFRHHATWNPCYEDALHKVFMLHVSRERYRWDMGVVSA